MPASTEVLLEQIKQVEKAIKTAEALGDDSSLLKKDLENLNRQFSACNNALNENKQVLKG